MKLLISVIFLFTNMARTFLFSTGNINLGFIIKLKSKALGVNEVTKGVCVDSEDARPKGTVKG